MLHLKIKRIIPNTFVRWLDQEEKINEENLKKLPIVAAFDFILLSKELFYTVIIESFVNIPELL